MGRKVRVFKAGYDEFFPKGKRFLEKQRKGIMLLKKNQLIFPKEVLASLKILMGKLLLIMLWAECSLKLGTTKRNYLKVGLLCVPSFSFS